MPDKRVAIVLEGDAAQLDQTLTRSGQGFTDLGSKAAAAGQVASEGLTKPQQAARDLGKAGEDAGRQLDSAFKNMGVRTSAQVTDDINKLSTAWKEVSQSGKLSGAELVKVQDQVATKLRDLVRERDALANGKSVFAGQAQDVSAYSGSLGKVKLVLAEIAAVMATLKMADFIRDAALAAARYVTLGVVMGVVGRNAGITRETMDAVSQSLQQQGISMKESRDSTIKLVQAGIDLAEANNLGRIAQEAATIAAISSSEAFKTLIAAIQTAQPEMLRTLGINVNFEESYRKFAASAGKTTEALSEQEKMQARVNAVNEAGYRILGVYVAAMSTAGKQITSFTRYFDDLKTVAGQALQRDLADGVAFATQKIKELTEYLKTSEAEQRIAAIGKTGRESFETLVTVATHFGTVFTTVLDGWNSLPSVIQDMGIVLALLGGAKAKGALALVGMTVSAFKELRDTVNDFDATNVGKATLDQQIKVLEIVKNTEGMGGPEISKEIQTQLDTLKQQRAALDADVKERKARWAQSEPKQELGNTKPIIPLTGEAWNAQRQVLYGTGGNLSKESQTEDAYRKFNAQYAYAMQGYDLAANGKLPQKDAIRAERDAYAELAKALKQIGTEGREAAKADAEALKAIDEVRNKALAAQAELFGDKWGQKEVQAYAEHQKAIDDITVKMVDYKGKEKELVAASLKWWADYEYGIKKASIAFDIWKEGMAFWADTLKTIGELSNNPAQTLAGGLMDVDAQTLESQRAINSRASAQNKQIWDDAVEASQKRGADLAAIWGGVNDAWLSNEKARVDQSVALNTAAELKKSDLREKSLGDLAKLDDGYIQRQLQGIANLEQHLRDQGVDESRIAVAVAQKKDALNKEVLETRMAYEDSYLGYLGDYFILEFGLYKDQETRKREMWAASAKLAVDYLSQIGSDLQTGLAAYTDALFTEDEKKKEESWRNMLDTMRRDSIRFLQDLLWMFAKNYLVIPVVGQFVGVAGAEGLAASGAQQGGSGGLNLGNVSKYGGYAKDAFNMFGGGASSMGEYGTLTTGQAQFYDTMMAANPSASAAEAEGYWTQAMQLPDSGASGSSGVMGVLGPGLAGAGAGYTLGNLLRPDTQTPGLAGAGFGLAAGTTAAMLNVGAGTTLATTLGLSSLAGPIGIAAGLIAATVGSLVTPNTTSYSWAKAPGTGQALAYVNGELVPQSYGIRRKVESGLGGSTTSHDTVFQAADPTISAQVTSAMTAATAGLAAFTKMLGISENQIKEANQGLTLPAMAFSDTNAAQEQKNAANWLSWGTLKNLGLLDQVLALAKDGEVLIDTVTRLSSAAESVGPALELVGLSMERMAGSVDKLSQGKWASEVIDAMGSVDAYAAAMTRYNNMVYSGAEQAEHALQYYAGKANTALNDIGASGLDLTNFQDQYRARMEAGNLAPEDFKRWADAAVYVEQAYNAATTAAQQQATALQEQAQAWQQTRQILASVADQLTNTRNSLRSFLYSLRIDQQSTLAPADNLATRQQAYNDALARARANPEDAQANQDFLRYAADFRDFAYQFYGANQEYVAIDQMIQTDTAGLISVADQQLQATNEQLARLDAQISIAQQQLAGTSLINDNLGRVASAVEYAGSSIITMLQTGAVDAPNSQADIIQDANADFLQAYQAQLAAVLGFSGGSSSPVPGFAGGGLVTGGIPGVDSVPIMAMPHERILSVPQSRMLETIYSMVAKVSSSQGTGTGSPTLERLVTQLLAAVAGGNASLAKLLAKVESNTAVVASEKERGR